MCEKRKYLTLTRFLLITRMVINKKGLALGGPLPPPLTVVILISTLSIIN
jgi:hypothetical protein